MHLETPVPSIFNLFLQKHIFYTIFKNFKSLLSGCEQAFFCVYSKLWFGVNCYKILFKTWPKCVHFRYPCLFTLIVHLKLFLLLLTNFTGIRYNCKHTFMKSLSINMKILVNDILHIYMYLIKMESEVKRDIFLEAVGLQFHAIFYEGF
jgi:hypothetical protein